MVLARASPATEIGEPVGVSPRTTSYSPGADAARLAGTSSRDATISNVCRAGAKRSGPGAAQRTMIVLRGGRWNNTADNARSANRNRNPPDNRNNNIGFALPKLPLGTRLVPPGTDRCPARRNFASDGEITRRAVRC